MIAKTSQTLPKKSAAAHLLCDRRFFFFVRANLSRLRLCAKIAVNVSFASALRQIITTAA
jgi:hypothetical protein